MGNARLSSGAYLPFPVLDDEMKISFLGGGNMAAALVSGMIAKGFAADQISVIELSNENRERLSLCHGVRAVAAPDKPALECDIFVLAVKPQQMRAALAPLAGQLGNALVVSIAAGLRVADLSRWLGGHRRIVRCMPNTPALIGAGITGLFADPSVDAAGRQAAEAVLGAVGSTFWVDDESRIDCVTALSGSGPAYVFHFIEAIEAAGVAQGFDTVEARRIAIDTVLGAAKLAAASDETPATLRERVTSKGGTTEAALKVFFAHDLVGTVGEAVDAAARRGRELGDMLSQD